MIESEHTYVPSYRCVLESKGSYLPARKSPETSDPDRWDLAVAGLYKRQAGTEAVKRLKHVILQFQTQNSTYTTARVIFARKKHAKAIKDLSQFMTKFNQVKSVASLRLAKFEQATGGTR